MGTARGHLPNLNIIIVISKVLWYLAQTLPNSMVNLLLMSLWEDAPSSFLLLLFQLKGWAQTPAPPCRTTENLSLEGFVLGQCVCEALEGPCRDGVITPAERGGEEDTGRTLGSESFIRSRMFSKRGTSLICQIEGILTCLHSNLESKHGVVAKGAFFVSSLLLLTPWCLKIFPAMINNCFHVVAKINTFRSQSGLGHICINGCQRVTKQ